VRKRFSQIEQMTLRHQKAAQPRKFSKEWRDLIVNINYSEIPVERLARFFIKGTATVAPKFHEIWSNRLIEFDLDMATSGLTKEPDIDSVIDAFDLWTENFVKTKQSSTQDIAMETLGEESDQPQKDSRSRHHNMYRRGRTHIRGLPICKPSKAHRRVEGRSQD
jgi:hypothetical protein